MCTNFPKRVLKNIVARFLNTFGFMAHPSHQGFTMILHVRLLSSAGTGKNCALLVRAPNPTSPAPDKNRAPISPDMLSNTRAGVWRKAAKAFPDLRTPQPATGVSRALRARSVPESVPENGGCPTGCVRGPSGPRALECPKSVARVSPECQKGVPDTPVTGQGGSQFQTPVLSWIKSVYDLRYHLRRPLSPKWSPPCLVGIPGLLGTDPSFLEVNWKLTTNSSVSGDSCGFQQRLFLIFSRNTPIFSEEHS